MNLQKVKTPRDAKYLQWLRTQPCCMCRYEPRDGYKYLMHAHHTTTGGMSIKGSDMEAVPLCFACHGKMDSKRKDDIPNLDAIIKRLLDQWSNR